MVLSFPGVKLKCDEKIVVSSFPGFEFSGHRLRLCLPLNVYKLSLPVVVVGTRLAGVLR
jgi:hypothetical protein